MNVNDFLSLVLNQVKLGTDDFNKKNMGVSVSMPNQIVCSIKVIIDYETGLPRMAHAEENEYHELNFTVEVNRYKQEKTVK